MPSRFVYLVMALILAPIGTLLASTLSITGITPSSITSGAYYSSVIASASGGSSPYTYSASSLPPGLYFNSASASIYGYACHENGNYSIPLSVKDSLGATASTSVSLSINITTTGQCSLSISPSSLNNGFVGTAYSQSFTASGGSSYVYSLAGALPPGLTLSSAGYLSGTPTTVGTYNFTVSTTDSSGRTGNATYSLSISAQPISITKTYISSPKYGASYSQTITTSGAPVASFSVTSGSLPTGLTINQTTGVISGISTSVGTFSFTITATATAQSGGSISSRAYTTTVKGSVSITTSSLGLMYVGTPYNLALATSVTTGATISSFKVSSGSLPSGLSLNTSTGVISGTPTKSGSYTVKIKVTSSTGATSTKSYSGTVSSSSQQNPSNFNAFDTSTSSGSINGYIQTKIADSSFSIDVVAISNSTVLTSFNGSVKVELVDATTSGSCASMTNIKTIASGYTFSPTTDAGRHSFQAISVSDTYPIVQIRITSPSSNPTLTVCSVDSFSIRPSSLLLTASDNDWVTPGTNRSLNGTALSSATTHKAGQPFTISVKSISALNNLTTHYDNNLDENVVCTLPSTNCTLGTLTTNLDQYNFINGIMTSAIATYSDAGVISLTLSDSSFTQIDATDGTPSNTLTITSNTLSIGRFIPDHFNVVTNTPYFLPSCGAFTYIGQPIKYSVNPIINVTAVDSNDSEIVNYAQLYKISPSDLTYGITPIYSETSHSITALTGGLSAPSVSNISNGSSTLTFSDTSSNILFFSRNNTPSKNFLANISMSFNLQDKDGVSISNVNSISSSNPVIIGSTNQNNGILFTNGNSEFRWGRLGINNANGPELLPLSINVYSEYFNGFTFIPNADDNCTSLSLNSNFSLNNPITQGGSAQSGSSSMTIGSGTSSASLSPASLNAGVSTLTFSAPGAGNTGYINVNTLISSGLPWLTYNWNQNGTGNQSPNAVITFGNYQGSSKMIFLKELH